MLEESLVINYLCQPPCLFLGALLPAQGCRLLLPETALGTLRNLLGFSFASYHPKWKLSLTLICPSSCKLPFSHGSHYGPMGWLSLLCRSSQNSTQQTRCQSSRKQLDPCKAHRPCQDTVGLKLGSSKTQMVSKQLETPTDLSMGRMRGFQLSRALYSNPYVSKPHLRSVQTFQTILSKNTKNARGRAITLSSWKTASKSPVYLTVKLACVISTEHLVSWAHYVPEWDYFLSNKHFSTALRTSLGTSVPHR